MICNLLFMQASTLTSSQNATNELTSEQTSSTNLDELKRRLERIKNARKDWMLYTHLLAIGLVKIEQKGSRSYYFMLVAFFSPILILGYESNSFFSFWAMLSSSNYAGCTSGRNAVDFLFVVK